MTDLPNPSEDLPAPDGSAIWEWDLDNTHERYSTAAAALLGAPGRLGNLDRATWMSHIHPDDAPDVAAVVERALAGTEQRWSVSYRVRTADGAVRRLLDRAFIVRVQGRPVRVLGVLEEEREAAEDEDKDTEYRQRIGERERLYRAIVEFIPQLCWAADASGWIYFYNPRWFEYTGTTAEQMEGWGWVDVHDPLDLPRLLRIWRNALATGQPWEDEFRLRRGSDGMLRWHLSRAMPLRDEDGRIVQWFGTNTDVHDQKLASQEYARLLASEKHLRREAESANQAKDEFLAVVSHELRTPLSVIMNGATLLRDDLPVEKRQIVCQRIERNARLQAKLVSDLLDVSRIVSGKLKIEFETVDVSTVVKQAVEEVRAAAREKGVVLSAIELEPGALVRGDPARLVQVLGNLLSNAIKFTPAGKAIGVRITAGLEHIEVAVQDEGVGIAAEFLPRLFRPFNQADATTTRQHGGLGLGLSIVRTLLDLQGGQAFAHSAGPGLGATFTIRLPRLSDVAEPGLKEAVQPLLPVPLTGVRLLVVDDQPDVRAMLADMLLSCGATVTTVASVHEAVLALRLGLPDVVISDIAMPEEDGYALVARIRAQPGLVGSMPVVALTAYASLADQGRALAAGFDRYLAKPADVARLSHAIAELLRDRLLEPRTADTPPAR